MLCSWGAPLAKENHSRLSANRQAQQQRWRMGVSFICCHTATLPERRLRAQYRSFLIYNVMG